MKRFYLHICYLVLFLLFSFSGVCQNIQTQDTVRAEKGDGIYSILRKKRMDPTKYFREFIELNKEKLGPENRLYIGRLYKIPLSKEVISADTLKIKVSDTIVVKQKDEEISQKKDSLDTAKKEELHPVFGKNQERVTILDGQLREAVFYLISGHGGPDPGALEKQNGVFIAEDEYAYDVTLRLARKLISRGATVYIIVKDPDDGIRDERLLRIDYDERNYPNQKISRNQKVRLKQRTEAVNELYLKHKQKPYQRLIVTHVDSRSKGKNIDVFFYHHEESKKGKKLAENIHSTFKEKYATYQPNRIYSGTVTSRSSLYLVKNTYPPMVYIELGNIKSKKDQRRILDYENRDALAKWICEGLIIDYQNSGAKN